MRKVQFLISGLLLVLLLVACAPQAVPAPQAPAAAAGAPAATAAAMAPAPIAPVKPAWEVEWEKAVAAAKNEGIVALATSVGREPTRELSEAFKNKYGIRVESIAGTVGTIASKILAERRAGIHLWDVIIGGTGGLVSTFKPGGGTARLEAALVLPDLTDAEVIKKVWYGAKLPWVDADRHLVGPLLFPGLSVAINTNLVKLGEVRSYDDLLNPKWKGKILLQNPVLPGTTASGHLFPMLYDFKGEDWVRKLAAQEPVVIGDERLGIEWLAHGRYPITIPPRREPYFAFVEAGAPILAVDTEDVMILAAASSTVSLIDKAPHPDAAKLFINWYLSKEGQTLMSKVYLGQSARLDVPTDFLPPHAIRKPGQKYWVKDREEVMLKILDYRKKSQEIFGHLIR